MESGTCLVFLPVGFVVPAPSLMPRCALTLRPLDAARTFSPLPHVILAAHTGRYIFCDTLRKITLPGRYPAPCPSGRSLKRNDWTEFGLSS